MRISLARPWRDLPSATISSTLRSRSFIGVSFILESPFLSLSETSIQYQEGFVNCQNRQKLSMGFVQILVKRFEVFLPRLSFLMGRKKKKREERFLSLLFRGGPSRRPWPRYPHLRGGYYHMAWRPYPLQRPGSPAWPASQPREPRSSLYTLRWSPFTQGSSPLTVYSITPPGHNVNRQFAQILTADLVHNTIYRELSLTLQRMKVKSY